MFKKIATYFLSILSLGIFSLAMFIVVAGTIAHQNNDLLKLFGYSYSVVATDSMEPTIEVGEIIIIREMPFDQIQAKDDSLNIEGDIVVYRSDIFGVNLVHRVVEIVENGELQTKGDNPRAGLDEETVTEEKYLGTVIAHYRLLNAGSLVLNYRNMVFFLIVVLFIIVLAREVFKIIHVAKAHQQEEFQERLEEEKQQLRETMKKEIEEDLRNEDKD